MQRGRPFDIQNNAVLSDLSDRRAGRAEPEC